MTIIQIAPLLGEHLIGGAGSFFGFITEPAIQRAPADVTVFISGATGNSQVAAEVGGDEVARVQVQGDGSATLIVPIVAANGSVGTHTVVLKQYVDTSMSSITVQYEVLQPPALLPVPLGNDILPVDFPERGSKWVIQDAYTGPGGLGSYVLPVGPSSMTAPHYEHSFNSRQVKSPNGQFHIFQGAPPPKEWSFSGYADSEEMVETLWAFRELNRRVYVIDHHGRAWKVAITNFDAKPRLRHFYNGDVSDWGSDWEMTVTVLDPDPTWVS